MSGFGVYKMTLLGSRGNEQRQIKGRFSLAAALLLREVERKVGQVNDRAHQVSS